MRISDLSSDACSSDLIAPQRAQQIVAEEDGGGIYLAVLRHRLLRQQERLHVVIGGDEAIDLRPRGREIVLDLQRDRRPRLGLVKVEGDVEIGRASCRERVCQYV